MAVQIDFKPWRVVSDGTGAGTHVYDPDGREVTDSIMAVEWQIGDGANPARLVLRPVASVVELSGEVVLRCGPDVAPGETP